MIETPPSLVPELKVTDLEASRYFYVDLIGFDVAYERPEDHFLNLVADGVQIMLEEITDDDRVAVGKLKPPLGRGVNFQILWPDFDGLLDRLDAADIDPFLGPEVRNYRVDELTIAQHQVWLQDPDAYLLRFTAPRAPLRLVTQRPV